jgi:hypothetical protein
MFIPLWVFVAVGAYLGFWWLARRLERWTKRAEEEAARQAMAKPSFWDGDASEDVAISAVWGDGPSAAAAKEELVRRHGHIGAAERIAAQARQKAVFAEVRALHDEVMGRAGEVA